MRARIFGLAVVAVCVLAFCGPALAQDPPPKPGPEHERMSAWLGKWTCETKDEGGGTMTCDWFDGGFFLECPFDWKTVSGAELKVATIMGYSKVDNSYTWYRYWSNGWSDYSKGWVRDAAWTWVFENERVTKGLRRRQVTCNFSEDGWTYKWERSVEGEPWTVTQEGKCTKGK